VAEKEKPAAAAAKPNEGTNTDANTATTVAEVGQPSTNPEPGPSEGLDTKDETAKNFVASGVSAHEYVKRNDAPSGDVLRQEGREVDRNHARDNLANMADGNTNHNTTAGVNPVGVAQADRPDYNPQRRPSSRANQMSSIGEGPREMADRVDAKKEAPTAAEIVNERRERAEDERSAPLKGTTSPFMGEN
jgi:hypothetical protein